MSPQFHSLLAKEWSQRRRWFWTGTAIMVYLLGYCVAYEIEYRTRAFVASFHSSCMLFAWIASVLFSMSTAAGEYSQRTLKFSASLPISLSKVAWARLLMTWLCLLGPIVISAILASVLLGTGFIEQAGIRPPDYAANDHRIGLLQRPSISAVEALVFLWTTVGITVCLGIYLFTVISLLGTCCRREGTIGFLGVIVVLASLTSTQARISLETSGLFFFSEWVGSVLPESMAINWGYEDQDGASYADLELAPLIAGPLAINFCLSILLGAWFARLYGRRSEISAVTSERRWWLPRMPRFISRFRWSIFWPGRLGALAWLDARQSVPLCLTGLVVAGILTWIGLRESSVYPSLESRLMKQLPESTLAIGELWAAIVAVGVFGAETKSKVEEFWRSRPIAPRSWFWMKFIVGLAALLATLDLVPSLGLWALGRRRDVGSGYLSIGLSATMYCTPLMHAQAYAFTAAAISYLRRPIHGAVVGLVLSYGASALLEAVPVYPKLSAIDVLNELNRADENSESLNLVKAGYPIVYGLVLAMTLIATLLARRTIVLPKSSLPLLLVATILGFGLEANAQDPKADLVKEIADGLERRNAAIHDLRMKLFIEVHHTGNTRLTSSQTRRSKTVVAGQPSDDQFLCEYLQKDAERAWTQSDPGGVIQSAFAFNGSQIMSYEPQGTSFVMEDTRRPQIRFPHPYGLLLEDLNLAIMKTLSELLQEISVDSIERQDVEGEQLITFTTMQPARRQEIFSDGRLRTVEFIGHRLRMTVNSAHHYWPVKVLVEQLSNESGQVSGRFETTASGWIESGSIVFPRSVEQVISHPKRNADGTRTDPPEFLVTEIKKCEIQELAVNHGLPDDAFKSPIPPGMGYYDGKSSFLHQTDESGAVTRYTPHPKGLRGAVFSYIVATVIVALIYLMRHPAGFARANSRA